MRCDWYARISPTSICKVPSLKPIFGGDGSFKIKPVNQLTSVPESLAVWKTTAAPTAQLAAVTGSPIVINSLYLRGLKVSVIEPALGASLRSNVDG